MPYFEFPFSVRLEYLQQFYQALSQKLPGIKSQFKLLKYDEMS